MPAGPKKRHGPPAYEGMGDVKVIRAKIVSVDKVKWTCSVQGEFDNQVLSGIPVAPTYLNSEGGGQFTLPETNSIVWLCFPSTDASPFILASSSLPSQTDEGDEAEDPNDHRHNRPVVNEGDQVLASSGTGRVILRRGGVIEIGASESAKRVYIPLTNLIREFSQNYEHFTGGGRLSMKARDDDESFGSEVTPTEFQLDWREFAEDDVPMIQLRMGRIKAEDDQRVINGALGEIVYSFTVNERYKIWIDKRGNLQQLVNGSTTESFVGPRFSYHDKTLTEIVKGTLSQKVGIRNVTVNSTDRLEVGRDREVVIGGKSVERVEGAVERYSGPVTEEVGSISRLVSGEMKETITNNVESTIGGMQTISVAQSMQHTVGERYKLLVPNAQLDGTAWEVLIANGQAQLHNVLGKNVFSVGPTPSTAVAKITMKVSGAIIISSQLGAVKLEVNPTGFKISTVAGVISLDSKGFVDLGPEGRGNVVTTLTHPVDYVTGAPILGSSFVRAGGIPAPGPAATPSIFVPDLTP